ncbi:MAG: LPXTG cell wall anchor domain-containing protein [Oscillospiraceae bacterium]
MLAKSDEHTWDQGIVTQAATTTETGVKTYTCQVCQATKTETIPLVVKAPATGDSSHMVMMAAAMVLSVTGAAWMLKKKIWVK